MNEPTPSTQLEVGLDTEAMKLKLDLIKAETQKGIAEARKAMAEADAATFKAGLYEGKAEPAKGETTVGEKSGSLLSLVAARALDRLAERIRQDIVDRIGNDDAILLVENRTLALTDAPWSEISVRLRWFDQRLGEAIADLERLESRKAVQSEEAPTDEDGVLESFLAAGAASGALSLNPVGLIGGAIMSGVGLVADVVGMFKTNYSVQGRDVSIDFSSLASLVSRKLTESDVAVILDGFLTLESAATLARFHSVLDKRFALEAAATLFESRQLRGTTDAIEALTARINGAAGLRDKAAASGDDATKIRLDDLLSELREERSALTTSAYRVAIARVATARALILACDQYASIISTVPAGQQYPPLIAAALRDCLHEGVTVDGIPTAIRYVLHLAVLPSGGDITTQQGLFTSNERLGLVGAVHASYLLVDRAGVVQTGGSLVEHCAARFDIGHNRFEWEDRT